MDEDNIGGNVVDNSNVGGSTSGNTSIGSSVTGGAKGDPATIEVGTTTTLDPGNNATVTNSGNENAAVLDFGIPKGDTGEQGIQGETGDTGPANELSIGTVTTGDAGSSADASITGDPPSQTLNLTIPKGDTGATGATGAKGDKGDKGDTGATGATGAKGDTGDAATVEVNSTSTGNPGTDAAVSNSGDEHSAKLDFTIPAGATWYHGATAPSTTHRDGDLYLNTTNGDVYQQSSGSWGSAIANLTGPQGSAGAASGNDTQVQFNNDGAFAGDAGLVYNKTTNKLTVAGDIAANNFSGSSSGSNTGDQDLSDYAKTADVPTNNNELTNGEGYVKKSDNSISGAGWLSGSVGSSTDKAISPSAVNSYAVPVTRKVNGHALNGDVTVTADDVGLGNADNTSDANKPISTATQAALDNKQDSSNAVTTDGTQTISGDKDYTGNVDLSLANVYLPTVAFSVSNAGNDVSISGGSTATLSFDTIDYDLGNNFSDGTFTASIPGIHHFDAAFANNGGSELLKMGLIVNGTSVADTLTTNLNGVGASVSGDTGIQISKDLNLDSGDTVYIHVYSDDGTGQDGGSNYNFFNGHLVTAIKPS